MLLLTVMRSKMSNLWHSLNNIENIWLLFAIISYLYVQNCYYYPKYGKQWKYYRITLFIFSIPIIIPSILAFLLVVLLFISNINLLFLK